MASLLVVFILSAVVGLIQPQEARPSYLVRPVEVAIFRSPFPQNASLKPSVPSEVFVVEHKDDPLIQTKRLYGGLY